MNSNQIETRLQPVGPGQQAEAFTDEEEAGGGMDIRRSLAAVWRFRWLILSLFVLGLGGGYGLSRVVKPLYEARPRFRCLRSPCAGASEPASGRPAA